MLTRLVRGVARRIGQISTYQLGRKGKRFHLSSPYNWLNMHCIFIGDDVDIRRDTIITPITEHAGDVFHPKVTIGNEVYIGHSVQIGCMLEVKIGNLCVLSDYVYLNDALHGMEPDAGPIMKQRIYSKGPIIIGDGTFIGYGARVLSGVTLGERCIVGAGAVVTKSFPAGVTLAGVPARVVRTSSSSASSFAPAFPTP